MPVSSIGSNNALDWLIRSYESGMYIIMMRDDTPRLYIKLERIVIKMGKYDHDGRFFSSRADQRRQALNEKRTSAMAVGTWAPVKIKGFPTHYMASTDGRIVNLKNGLELKGTPNAYGYLKVEIVYDTPSGPKKIKTGKHRVIAETFIPNPKNLPEVNHKDGVHDHNSVGNLEWVTSVENAQHAIEHGLREFTGAVYSLIPEARLKSMFYDLICDDISDEKMSEIYGCAPWFAGKLRDIAKYLHRESYMADDGSVDLRWKNLTDVLDVSKCEYDVSPYGLIRNRETGYIIQGNVNGEGYNKVVVPLVDHNGVSASRKLTVGRVVALAFVPNPENKPQVCHDDGNKMHEWVGNLLWVTEAENAQHRNALGLMTVKYGSENGRSVYTEDQVKRACDLMMIPKPPYHIEQETGVKRIDQYRMKKGILWKHITKDYKFPEGRFTTSGKFVGADGTVIDNGDIRDKTLQNISKYSDEQIKMVCEMLMNPDNRMSDITAKTGVEYNIINAVKKRRRFTHISKEYKFPRVIENRHSRKVIWNYY